MSNVADEYHEEPKRANRERIYNLLWRTGYGFGGLNFMQIVAGTGLSERTVRKRLEDLIAEKRVVRRLGGYKIGNVIYGGPEIVKIAIAWEGKIIRVPIADFKGKSRWDRAHEELRDHYRGSLGESIDRIMRGKDLPRVLKRPYYTTSDRLYPAKGRT